MQARELVSILSKDVGTALTKQELLETINRVQNEVFAETTQLMRIKPDPFLTTVDGTYSYVASTGLFDSTDGTKGTTQWDIRTVKKIYSFDNLDTSITWVGNSDFNPGSYRPNLIEYLPSSTNTVGTIDVIESLKADNSDCKIIFFEGNNPGDTTITWRAQAYRWPNQVTSPTTELEIPDDFADNLYYWGVMKRVQRAEYGRNDGPVQQFEYYLKKFRSKYNRAPAQREDVCYPRDF